ncbi:DUF2854 domain-containing protein [Thermosynechococcus sp. HN-54]|uniref:DUF2854 domain-containing protein n=1 Tax=Thermosynechococcus sp. HN-54 TaxID=2933959 RepID=UPI00202D0947|nr:DUF2854 domain-containing protein [Thermosynechococcus sp. HN-54]URR35246.1 DUF2854 domain-containing protein [Thermosynechococcus sp. HN-54]
MLGSVSLGTLGLIVGSLLTVVGVAAYATGNATLNLAGFFYGVPLLLGGLALKAAELKPVPYREAPTPEVIAARAQATPTQTQIRKDVTRYRYGQEAHLDSTLTSLGLSPSDAERPVLVAIAETLTEGAYTLVLEFDSPAVPLEVWQSKQAKMQRFFGPNINVAIIDRGDNRIAVALIRETVANPVPIH